MNLDSNPKLNHEDQFICFEFRNKFKRLKWISIVGFILSVFVAYLSFIAKVSDNIYALFFPYIQIITLISALIPNLHPYFKRVKSLSYLNGLIKYYDGKRAYSFSLTDIFEIKHSLRRSMYSNPVDGFNMPRYNQYQFRIRKKVDAKYKYYEFIKFTDEEFINIKSLVDLLESNGVRVIELGKV